MNYHIHNYLRRFDGIECQTEKGETMKNKLHILQHSLGLDQFGEGRQYRNHFAAGPGGQDFADCVALTEMGLSKKISVFRKKHMILREERAEP